MRAGYRKRSGASAEATVFAVGAPRLDRVAAVCSNGMAIAWCELDEGFRNASCHGGAYTIPALLAEAEARGLSVEQLVRAVAVAYEVTTRFALAYPFLASMFVIRMPRSQPSAAPRPSRSSAAMTRG